MSPILGRDPCPVGLEADARQPRARCRRRHRAGRGHRPGRRPGRVHRPADPDRPHRPDRRPVRARRPRLRRREARHHQGLRQPVRHDADDVRRPAAPGRRLLGPRPARHGAAAELPDQPLRVRPVHVRRPDRRHGPGVERRLPDTARPDDGRVRGERPAVAVPGGGRRGHGPRAGAHQRLVPAAPEPLHRHRRVRARRRALRQRRRRRELRRRRLRPDRRQPAEHAHPGEPVRGPGRRGRRAPEPGPADGSDRRRRGRRRTDLQRDRAGRCPGRLLAPRRDERDDRRRPEGHQPGHLHRLVRPRPGGRALG